MGPWDSAQPCPLAPRAGGDPESGGQCSGHLLEKSGLRASVTCPLHASVLHIPCPEQYKRTFNGKDATSQIPFGELSGRDSLQHGRMLHGNPVSHGLCVHTYVCPCAYVHVFHLRVSLCLHVRTCMSVSGFLRVHLCVCMDTDPRL